MKNLLDLGLQIIFLSYLLWSMLKPTHPTTHLPTDLPTYLTFYLPTYLIFYLPTYQPTYLPTHLLRPTLAEESTWVWADTVWLSGDIWVYIWTKIT